MENSKQNSEKCGCCEGVEALTPVAIFNVKDIAAAAADSETRLAGLILGTNDLAKETGAKFAPPDADGSAMSGCGSAPVRAVPGFELVMCAK